MAKKCKKCGMELADDALFCAGCGMRQDDSSVSTVNPQAEPVQTVCKNCGTPVAPGSVFCPTCGAAIAGDEEVRPKEKSTLQKYWKAVGAVLVGCGVLFKIISGIDSGDLGSGSSKTSIKADTLMEDYIRSPRNADKQYKGKTVHLTGRCENKGQFNNSNDYYLEIGSKFDRGKSYTVVVDIPAKKVKQANSVKEGDFVNVTGTCVGIVKQDDPDVVSIQIQADSINQ